MTKTESELASLVASLTHAPVAANELDDPLFGLGLDSLQLIQLAVAVEERFGCATPAEGVRARMSVRRLAAWIDKRVHKVRA